MIAREGIPFILIGLALTVILMLIATKYDSNWAFGTAILFGLLTLFTTFFFRDPNRSVPVTAGMLVSPADGKVIRIDTLENHPYVGGRTIKISIFLSVFDVHVNRVPAEGRIEYVKYNPGKFFAAFADKASELNEQTEIGMTTPGGAKIMFKQIAGLIARRIVCHLKPEDKVSAGERFGLIRFGSRTELFVPAGSKIEVAVGDRVTGGKSIIGYLGTTVSSTVAPGESGTGRK
jgi:phosphatidylserine decarboxylase